MDLDIALVSDLHLEGSSLDLEPGRAHVLAVVGDVCAPKGRLKGDRADHEGVLWLADRVHDRPVLMVPGNHDYEGSRPLEALESMRRSAQDSRVVVLWNETFDWEGVRFIGTPFWSDPTQGKDQDAETLLADVERLTDLARVYGDDGKPMHGRWVIEQHLQARAFVAAELARDLDLPKVVLTHWAPSVRSQSAEYAAKPLSGYWASDSEDLVEQAQLWLHGHIHDSVDYRVGSDPTRGRVVSNPRGRSKTFGLATNTAFVQPKIVSLPRPNFGARLRP